MTITLMSLVIILKVLSPFKSKKQQQNQSMLLSSRKLIKLSHQTQVKAKLLMVLLARLMTFGRCFKTNFLGRRHQQTRLNETSTGAESM